MNGDIQLCSTTANMGIQALPPSAICTLSSSQVITNPESVIKELLDNALDAQATAIFIEISTNVLDVIQVRDNGHGVPPQDRPLLCRRHCTSKIKDLSDLKMIGPRSLGFRGDALASIAELSSALTITTRIESEAIAGKLCIGRNGEIRGMIKASHPVGTTVRIQDFLHILPVRKHMMVKSVARRIPAIQRLLQAYALARPSVRLSLRILKTNNDKGNWTYAPRPDASNQDVAFSIVGNECATSCQWTSLEIEGYELRAFLPRSDALPSTVSGFGSFISIDSRPVSAVRGLLKQIVSLFRDHLRSATPAFRHVRDPFLWLSITCPPQTYDPNVEPAKDDVVFAESDKVQLAMRNLLETVYPPIQQAISSAVTSPERMRCSDFEERNQFLVSSRSIKRPKLLQQTEPGGSTESSHVSAISLDEGGSSDENIGHSSVSNPWIFAKMISSTRVRDEQLSAKDFSVPSRSPLQKTSSSQMNSQAGSMCVSSGQNDHFLPTPENSSPAKELTNDEHYTTDMFPLRQHPAPPDLPRSIERLPSLWSSRTRSGKTVAATMSPVVAPNESATELQLHGILPNTYVSRGAHDASTVSVSRARPRRRAPLAYESKAFRVPSKVATKSLTTRIGSSVNASEPSCHQNISNMFKPANVTGGKQMHLPESTMQEQHNLCNRPIRPHGSLLDLDKLSSEYIRTSDSSLTQSNLHRSMSPIDSEVHHSVAGERTLVTDSTPSPLLDLEPSSSGRDLQCLVHVVSTSAEETYQLTTQLEDVGAQAYLPMNEELEADDVDALTSATSSSLQFPPLSEGEARSWSIRLGLLLRQCNTDHAYVLDESRLEEHLKSSLRRIQSFT